MRARYLMGWITVQACCLMLLALGVVGGILAIGFIAGYDLPRDVVVSDVGTEYSFEPTTIQQAITQGDLGIFHLQHTVDYSPGHPPWPTQSLQTATSAYSPQSWTEADFARVVSTSIRLLDKTPLDEAQLFQVEFQTDCHNADLGPQTIIYRLFKVTQSSPTRQFLERSATVNILTGRLEWDEMVLLEVINERRSLDRQVVHLPAEAALRIAEDSGGQSLRVQLNNACRIDGFVAEWVPNAEWQVKYMKAHDSLSAATIYVNSLTRKGRLEFATPVPSK